MKKILIIEDEKILLEVLQKKLSREGYEIITAKDGLEGLEKIRAESPNLVILDIVIPKMGGFEVIEKMREEPDLKSIPIIIISNSGQTVEIEKALRLGAKDYLIKTEFDPKEVIEKVKKQIGEEKKVSATTNKNEGGKLNKDGPKILIIEDDQFLRGLITRKLEKEKYVISEAVDGEEGLRKIREEKPDLILLDLILPSLDGFEVLREAKSDPEVKDIPVIVLSNLGQKEDVDRAFSLGAVDYLIKAHFTPEEIIEKVKKVIG